MLCRKSTRVNREGGQDRWNMVEDCLPMPTGQVSFWGIHMGGGLGQVSPGEGTAELRGDRLSTELVTKTRTQVETAA